MATHVPVLVALSGVAGSGKSTVAYELYCERDDFVRVKFADGLKNMVRALLETAGCPEDEIERYIEGDLKEEPTHFLGGESPRHVMVTLGTDWGRKMISDTLWVSIATARIDQLLRAGHNVVVDDLRFRNEELALMQRNAVFLNIERDSDIAVIHQSEGYRPLSATDIDNNGDLRETMRQVAFALNI